MESHSHNNTNYNNKSHIIDHNNNNEEFNDDS